MKYKVGDRIKIINATEGCYGANGRIGTVTNKPSTDGLCCDKDGFNVDCGRGGIWKIGFGSECELLDELTAEEAIKIFGEICCENQCFNGCPIGKARGKMSCHFFRRDKPKEVLEILKQWKKEHEKKEIETEFACIVRVIEDLGDSKRCVYDEDVTEVKDETFKMTMKRVLEEYCKEHEGKFFAVYEEICRVKE